MYHDNGFKLYISENMGKEKQGFLSVNNQNSVTMLKTYCTKCERRYKNSPIKAAIATTINATVAGAAISLVMDAVFFYLRSTFSVSPPRLVSLNLSNQLAKVTMIVYLLKLFTFLLVLVTSMLIIYGTKILL